MTNKIKVCFNTEGSRFISVSYKDLGDFFERLAWI